MPFSFLNPWIWLGALAVGAPIWLHLRRRRETNLLQFSALRFLEDQPLPQRSPLRLRRLMLLALRVLALLLVVAGFAWPYLRQANTTPIRESRVYVLDNTMSHQANGGFARDRDGLAREVEAAGPDLQIGVVELTGTPRVVVSLSEDHRIAAQAVAQLQPSFQRGAYLAAFRQANSLLANSFGAAKRIVLLGDDQQNQWSETASTPPFLRDVKVDLPRLVSPPLPNLSLAEPRAQRIFLGDKSLVNFTLKLSHSGPATAAALVIRANGQTVLSRKVDLEKQPETILLQAQWEAEPGIWLRGEALVEAQPDALEADNYLYFSLAPVVEGKVLVLAQSPYLRLALSPDIMRGQWAARVLEPANVAAEAVAEAGADVLCLESSYLQSVEVRKLLWRYLSNGRGVLLLVNRTTPAIDGYLQELGFEAEGTVTTPKGNPERFQFVFANHPIFHPFLAPDYGNLLEVQVSQYTRLKAAQAIPLIFSEHGAGLFFQSSKFPGKLLVAAFGMDRDHTTWPIHQTFVPFLDLALQGARGEAPTPTNFEPGELAAIQLPTGARARELVLTGQQGEVARSPVEQGRGLLRMPDRPGLYTLAGDNSGLPEQVFSVNPSPKESQLVYADAAETVRTWQIKRAGTVPEAPPADPHMPLRLAGILQQRCWWWMVLGGLGVLWLETIWAHARRPRA
jgi:hypothetical protein